MHRSAFAGPGSQARIGLACGGIRNASFRAERSSHVDSRWHIVFGIAFAIISRIGSCRACCNSPSETTGRQEQHPRLFGSVCAPVPTTRVANHEETKAGPPARTARPFDPTCRDQPRLPASSPHPDEVGQVRRGTGRNAGLDHASQKLLLVSPSRPSPASSLGLRGTAQRDLPLPRLSLRCRRDGRACTKCLSSWWRRRAGKRGSVLRVIGANQFGGTDQG